jgi:hypothetical protein
MGELLGSYEKYPDKSVVKQCGRLFDRGSNKKLAGIFIMNLVKLVKLDPGSYIYNTFIINP